MSGEFATDVAGAECGVLSARSCPVDFEGALRRLEDDTALLAEIADMFRDQCPEMVAQIRQAIHARDAAELKRSAHKLKGCVGYLGANDLARLAHRLECIGESGQLGEVHECFSELLAALDDVLQALAGRVA